MMKLEGDSIKDFNPDASIQYWFDVIARRPGGSQTMENIKHAKETTISEHHRKKSSLGPPRSKIPVSFI